MKFYVIEYYKGDPCACDKIADTKAEAEEWIAFQFKDNPGIDYKTTYSIEERSTDMWPKFGHLKDEFHDMMVTATLKKDVDAVERTLPAGTRVRVVMLSRFGDVGITDQLDRTGYCARVGGYGIDDMSPRNGGGAEEWFTDIQGMDESDLHDLCLHVHGGYVDVVRDQSTSPHTWSVIIKNCETLHDGVTDREDARRLAEAHIDSEYAYWSKRETTR